MTTTPTAPPHDPAAPPKAERKPHDPIRRLWRYSQGDRLRLLAPFVGQWIWIDRWHGRVAANGDTQYEGELIAYAISTVGRADLLILRTDSNLVWAISAAQVAELRLVRSEAT